MSNVINDIASRHLGKAGDGTVVKPYVTPDSIDSSLLVAIPRIENRRDYNIDEDNLPFVGLDVWNAYEVSALTNSGFPVTGIVKIVYSSDSKFIVESKSLKLYLNSFNMDKLGDTAHSVQQQIEFLIREDLSSVLETDVQVKMFTHYQSTESPQGFDMYIEDVVDESSLSFDSYNETADLLTYVEGDCHIKVKCGLLRSNCRVTNQPDWGTLFIEIKGAKTPTYESLLQYIVSMRKENHFHEEIVECIYKRLYDAMPGVDILVAALYTRRGGIDINPIRATQVGMLKSFSNYIDINKISYKTLNQ